MVISGIAIGIFKTGALALIGDITKFGFAALLFFGLLLNWILDPTRQLLRNLDRTEYQLVEAPNLHIEARG